MTSADPGRETRGYQADAVEAIVSGLAGGGRRQLIMACGTGKTYVASQTAARLAGDGVTAVLVPSILLAAQTITAWQAGCPTDQVLAVCSDPTVRPTWVRSADLPARVTTDVEEIAKWLAGVSGRALAVAVFDSAHRLAAGLRRAGQVTGLTVCDEAHRLAGAHDKFTAAIAGPGFLPERRHLSMTATPKFIAQSRGKPRAVSMDDEELFGPVAYRYPFRRAIDDGWLKDYRIVVAALTSRQVAELLAAEDTLAEGDMPVRLGAAQAALAMAAAQYRLRRCLAFLPRIAAARQFAGRLPATLALLPAHRRPAGPLAAGYVHGAMSSLQRDLVLEHLRHPPDGGWAVVANARCLGEGVDVPEIDSVLFGAPKESVTDIVQAVGRALRRGGDTDTATIIVPALVPGDGEDGEPDGGRYEHVLNVIRAMCAHDDSLADALGAARAARAASPDDPVRLPPQVAVIGPPGILQATLDSLSIHVLDKTTSSWWDGYGHARAYHREHGTLDVPYAWVTPGGYPLGAWLSAQRAARNNGTLTAERIRLLDALGMIWDLLEDAWMSAYSELRAFGDAHGHLEVPLDYVTADGIMLAEWQGTQRDTDRAGKMTPARRALLEAIGFTLEPRKARWTRRYAQLAAAITRCGSPASLPPGSPEATWLEGQMLAHHHGKLDDGKIALLEKLGITVRRPDPWDAACQDLEAFKDEHGHLRVPEGYTGASGIDLSDWKAGQRVRRKAGRMTPDQEKRLNEAGFDWDPGEDAWQARYAEAAAWKDEHGSLRFPRRHPVGDWLYRQQKLHDKRRLGSDRASLLRALGALTRPETQDTQGAPHDERLRPQAYAAAAAAGLLTLSPSPAGPARPRSPFPARATDP
ncbi:MAG TPA: Helicase associated domain protein [Streptosporangiaceae bacterium]